MLHSHNSLARVLRDEGVLEKASEYEERAYAIILFSLVCFTFGDM